jgi:iron(III) transport system permease protein
VLPSLALGISRSVVTACTLCGLAVFVGAWSVLWFNPDVGVVFQTTLSIALGVWWRCLVIGTLLAYGIFRLDLPGRRVLLSLLVAGSLVSLGLTTVAWKAAWQSPDGWADEVVYQIGGFWLSDSPPSASQVRFPGPERSANMRGESAVIWVHVCAMIPWSTGLMGLALRGNQGRLEDLWRTERRGWWWWPHQSRWFAASLLLGFWILAITMSEIAASDIFYVRTYAEEIYLGFPLGELPALNPLRGDAHTRFPWIIHVLAVTSTGFALSLTLFYFSAHWLHSPFSPERRLEIGKWGWPLSLVLLSFLAFCTLVPLGDLWREVGSTVLITETGAEPVWQWKHAANQLISVIPRLHTEALWSSLIAVGATLVTLIASQFLAWQSLKSRGFRGITFMILGLMWAIPSPLIGVLCLQAVETWDWNWLRKLANQSLTLPIATLTVYLLPISFTMTFLIVRRTPLTLWDASRIEYSNSILQWYHAALRPQLIWHLALAWFLLVTCLNDITATNLVLPAGTDTIARRILGLVHAGVDDQVAATALWSYGISAFLGGTCFFFLSAPDEN